ncbi:MAG: hypothetical protein CM15mP129_11530 [Chloroflexota bacterium]|nr:MAG: hypothetical protein CM15mP129_11530 [Chloroflexota bacterium]
MVELDFYWGKDGPESFAENTLKMKNLKEGFSIIKQGIAVHGEFVKF